MFFLDLLIFGTIQRGVFCDLRVQFHELIIVVDATAQLMEVIKVIFMNKPQPTAAPKFHII